MTIWVDRSMVGVRGGGGAAEERKSGSSSSCGVKVCSREKAAEEKFYEKNHVQGVLQ